MGTRHGFRIVNLRDQLGTEIGLPLLLREVEFHERLADPMSNARCNQRVQNAGPEHVAGYVDGQANFFKGNRAGKRPQNGGKTEDGEQRTKKRNQQIERLGNQYVDVFRDSLVGVVRLSVFELKSILSSVFGKPSLAEIFRHPGTPVDDELFLQPIRIHKHDNESADNQDEFPKKRINGLSVELLDCIEKSAVPVIEFDGKPHG